MGESEINEFHQRDGWFFERLDNGSVRIRRAGAGADVIEHTVPGNEWVSILAAVAALRNSEVAYSRAHHLHWDLL